MNYVILFIFCGLVLISQVYASEVTLIDSNKSSADSVQIDEEEINDDESLDHDSSQADDFKEMDDFINQENERLKEIKLLNLDLEKANLELKRRDIEQKIVQLDKVEGSAIYEKHENRKDKLIKLAGIFESKTYKQAILNISGVHINVQEGQNIDGILVKAIKSKAITIEYPDGQIQELY